jgi:predicted AAA+ superfamily ATPase
MRAYAAATGTTTGYESILDAASPGEGNKAARATTVAYRDVLESLWLFDDVPAWGAALGSTTRLSQTPKHFLADPGLAASLLGLDADMLTRGVKGGPFTERYGSITGRLFEALVALDLHVYASALRAEVSYLRTARGEHEVDFIVRQGLSCVGIDVKLSPTINDHDVRHLVWLKERLGPEMVAGIVVTTGPRAYRRATDGVFVVPAALLGP